MAINELPKDSGTYFVTSEINHSEKILWWPLTNFRKSRVHIWQPQKLTNLRGPRYPYQSSKGLGTYFITSEINYNWERTLWPLTKFQNTQVHIW